MTDRTKFEQMLEHLINEETSQAKELFHQLVVEKSREIYEGILSEDFDDDTEEFDSIGGDETDDFIDDVDLEKDEDGAEDEEFGSDEFGEEPEEEDLEDRIVDLEDALDDLRAEFESLMADEDSEGDEMDFDSEEGDEFGSEEPEDEFGSDEFSDEDEEMPEGFVREYVEKVAAPKMGDNGVNTKSIVAGRNNMGGTAANIVKGGTAKGEGTKGGLLKPTTQEKDWGNVNVPGGKGATKLNKVAAPSKADNTDNTRSPVIGQKRSK